MRSRTFSWAFLLIISVIICLSFATIAHGSEADTESLSENDEDDIAAQIAADEAAAAAVNEAADDDDEDAGALDEDADSARPDFERRHPLTDIPPPSEDAMIGHAFAENLVPHDKTDFPSITLGNPIKAVVAFANNAKYLFHVWGVIGSLNMDKDYRNYVQNFTYEVVNKTVAPGSELSFSYSFTPNDRLDIRNFQLALTVFYEAQSSSGNAIRGHATTFYNSTITAKPGTKSSNNGIMFLLTIIVIGAGIGAYFIYQRTEATKVTAAETGTENSSKNEWLAEHQKMVQTGGGRAKSKSDRSK